MSELVNLHSRLSSIMEMLANTAVAEITKLVDEYAAFLRLELVGETRRKDVDNVLQGKLTALTLKEGRSTLESGHSYTVLPLQIEQLGSGKVPSPHECAVLSNTASNEENRNREKGILIDKSFNQPIIKHEITIQQMDGEIEVDSMEGKYIQNALSPSSSPPVSQHKPPAEQPNPVREEEEEEEEWKFHVPQAGSEQEPYLDTTDSIKDLYDNQHADIELNLKMEPESPEPSIQLRFDEGDPGFEVHTGTQRQTFPDYSALFLGSECPNSPEPGPFNCFSSQQPPHTLTTNTSSLLLHGHPTSDDNPFAGCHGSHPGSGSGSDGSLGHNSGTKRTTSSCLSVWSAKKYFRFVCNFCSKSFVYQSELKRHELVHTKERAYHCSHCGRSFIRRSHLRRHELLHTNQQRPFPCPHCGQSFCKSVQLDTHMKTHCG